MQGRKWYTARRAPSRCAMVCAQADQAQRGAALHFAPCMSFTCGPWTDSV